MTREQWLLNECHQLAMLADALIEAGKPIDSLAEATKRLLLYNQTGERFPPGPTAVMFATRFAGAPK